MVYKVLLQHHREQYRCGAVGVEGIQVADIRAGHFTRFCAAYRRFDGIEFFPQAVRPHRCTIGAILALHIGAEERSGQPLCGIRIFAVGIHAHQYLRVIGTLRQAGHRDHIHGNGLGIRIKNIVGARHCNDGVGGGNIHPAEFGAAAGAVLVLLCIDDDNVRVVVALARCTVHLGVDIVSHAIVVGSCFHKGKYLGQGVCIQCAVVQQGIGTGRQEQIREVNAAGQRQSILLVIGQSRVIFIAVLLGVGAGCSGQHGVLQVVQVGQAVQRARVTTECRDDEPRRQHIGPAIGHKRIDDIALQRIQRHGVTHVSQHSLIDIGRVVDTIQKQHIRPFPGQQFGVQLGQRIVDGGADIIGVGLHGGFKGNVHLGIGFFVGVHGQPRRGGIRQ